MLITRPGSDGDTLGSLVGLGLALTKLGKEVVLICPDSVPPQLSFLPAISQVKQEFVGTRDLVVSIDLVKAPVDRISYRKDPAGKKLDILVTPKSGTIPEEAVEVAQSDFRFDLIIILDTPDLEQLAAIYDAHTRLFFETPVVNIDHHPGNDYFGKVNWVDLTATSTCEILVSLIESLAGGESLWDADMATALLTGLLWDTQSFQSETTTPKSLTVAAQLIALGARQQEIVKSLFKTRPLSTLKLWGTILAGLKVDDRHRFVWAEVKKEELVGAGAQSSEAGALMDELIKNASSEELAVIFLEETPEKVVVLVHALGRNVNLNELARRLGGRGGTNRVLFSLPGPIAAAREKVLEEIKTFQSERVAT